MGIEEIAGCIPCSSFSVHRWKYDVFVSFKGEDIRKTFAAHLFRALKQAGFSYFEDKEKMEAGIFHEPNLVDAIRHSRVSLIMFTADYADSRRCLEELLEILECNRRFRDHQGHAVLPIFYDVEPSDVRKQSGGFGDGFGRCLATQADDLQVQKWRDSLKEAGNLSGWHLSRDANGCLSICACGDNPSKVIGRERITRACGWISQIKLDYPREYLISFSGYFGDFFGYTIVRSLAFQSNERTFGPIGVEDGKYFSFPSTGRKIVGFHGRSGLYLDSLGAHFEP
ncbi:TMV resistance protein N-like [Rhodamnia argentea]|uniref:TMV resistance protein N-like n=1 Tax=Rhodamnia argentea TaxID=178133 RepID=A0A8B8MPB6_9MYRT|nr:TMV resistance protein N-like [Rhodamnia argentea]